MKSPEPEPPVFVIPWATAIVVALAVAAYFVPGAADGLVYDRADIAEGEWWRIVTGQWVHFSPGHLGWNLAVLLPAGIWAEQVRPARARWLFVVAPIVIGAALFSFDPQLSRYGGLSGLAAGTVAFLAIAQLRTSEADRWFWRAVLALLALKIVAEVALASPLLAHFPDAGIRSVPLAHLAGVIAAGIVLGRRRPLRPAE